MNYRFPYSSEIHRDYTGEAVATYDQEVIEGLPHSNAGWYDVRGPEWALLAEQDENLDLVGSVFLTALISGLFDKDKPYTITEALTVVRDAAREDRKLEAWCEENIGLGYRYDVQKKQFFVVREDGTLNFWISLIIGEFSVKQVLGTWHVREVANETH